MEHFTDEILIRIFLNLSGGEDTKNVRLVSTRWCAVMAEIDKMFASAVKNNRITWTVIEVADKKAADLLPSHDTLIMHGDEIYLLSENDYNKFFNVFSFSSNKWRAIQPPSHEYESRNLCTAVAHGHQLIIHGGHAGIDCILNDTHIYDIRANTWRNLDILTSAGIKPVERYCHSASLTGDLMVIFGGQDNGYHLLNDVWTFNVVTDVWQELVINGKEPSPRCEHSQFTIDANQILVCGGFGMLREPLRDMWLLSLSTNCWTEINVDLTHAPPPAWWLKSNILVMSQGLIITFVGEKTGNSQRESKNRLEMYVIDCNNIHDSLSCE